MVGSGAGGLTAAITATLSRRQKVLVIEKAKWFGGTSAFSGGALWVPMNPQSLAKYPDSRADAERYIRNFVKREDYNETLVSAYLDSAPEMVKWLESQSAARFVQCPTPDYYLHIDGALKAGRTILNAPYNGRRLGKGLVKQVRYPLQGYCAFGSMQTDALELNIWTHPFSSWRNFSLVTKGLLRYAVDQVLYGKGTLLCNGNALVGRLLESATKSGIQLWNNAAAVEPILEKDRVVGIIVSRGGGGDTRIRARKGVILASGGFARNAAWSRRYLPSTANSWTVSPRGNSGDGIQIGLASGGNLPPSLGGNAALWSSISEIRTRNGPNRTYPHFGMGLTKPGSIIVDSDGKRFANESDSYQNFGKVSLEAGIQNHYLVANKTHLRKYGIGAALPAPYPVGHLFRNGYLITASTIPELAKRIGINPQQLSATVERFNGFARDGKDLDFNRGEGSFDRAYGDPENKPNPCLAPLDKGPFYAIPMYAGNGITMYGLDTNKDGQVLNASGSAVPGLYAVGADANHFLRGHYPSGGLTLGPSMVFGYRAGLHVAK